MQAPCRIQSAQRAYDENQHDFRQLHCERGLGMTEIGSGVTKAIVIFLSINSTIVDKGQARKHRNKQLFVLYIIIFDIGN